jgi:hypothetical protein
MAKAEIQSGICGFCTTVTAASKGELCGLNITTDCGNIKKLAVDLTEVDPLQEITYTGEEPKILKKASEHLPHPGCPVPSGIIKAMEVESGLALPKDATIKVMRD